MKAAKLDTMDAGLFCQGCRDLLHRLDVCFHTGVDWEQHHWNQWSSAG